MWYLEYRSFVRIHLNAPVELLLGTFEWVKSPNLARVVVVDEVDEGEGRTVMILRQYSRGEIHSSCAKSLSLTVPVVLFTPQLEYDRILVVPDNVPTGPVEETGLILLGDGDYLSSRFPKGVS